MRVYRRVKQTKYSKDGLKGLLTIHDHGRMAVSMDHKELFSGLKYVKEKSYYAIANPTTEERTIIFNRLFDFETGD